MRTETVTIKYYQYDELSDKAKEAARDWYRSGGLDYDWWEFTFEDAKRIGCEITEFDCGRGNKIGFRFTVSPGQVARLILENHGGSCETFKIANKYLLAVKGLDGSVQAAEEFRKSLGEEYLSMLRREEEHLNSDEAVEESILANQYEFNEEGKRI